MNFNFSSDDGVISGVGTSIRDTTNDDFMSYAINVREFVACGLRFDVEVIGEGYSDALEDWVYSDGNKIEELVPSCEEKVIIVDKQISRDFCEPDGKSHSSIFYLGLKNLTYTDIDSTSWPYWGTAQSDIQSKYVIDLEPQLTIEGFDNVKITESEYYRQGTALFNYTAYDSNAICEEGEHAITVKYTVKDLDGNELEESPITYRLGVPN